MSSVVKLQVGSRSIEKSISISNGTKTSVALVRPPVIFPKKGVGNEATPCIGLAYILGYLKKYGYDPVLIDSMAEALNKVWAPQKYSNLLCQGLTFEDLIARIPKGTKVIGVTAMFSGEWPVVRDLISAIKLSFPDSLLVAGGEHITALTEYCLRDCPAIDYCIRGEGEHAFFEFCENVSTNQSLKSISGVTYIDSNGEYISGEGLTRIKNIDAIPWPIWPEGYLENFWSAGKSFGPQTARDMPMMLTRGCPYRCTFCSNPSMWTIRYSLRDIEDIILEVKCYIKRFDITGVQLYDLTAITKKDWAVKFLKRLQEENIKVKWAFSSGTRSEILDKEVLTLLKEIGTNYLCYAPESGSEATLKRIKKQINLKKMEASITTAKKMGHVIRVNTIIGFPEETRKDVWKTLFFGVRMSIKGVDDIQPYIYMPYPGSELFEQLTKRGQIVLGDTYFLSLIGLNSDLSSLKPLTFNENISSLELALYRLSFTALSYGLGYLLHPSRIIRTIKNLFSSTDASTVMEARLKGVFSRWRGNPAT